MSTLGQINRVKYAFNKKLLSIIINSLVFSKLFHDVRGKHQETSVGSEFCGTNH